MKKEQTKQLLWQAFLLELSQTTVLVLLLAIVCLAPGENARIKPHPRAGFGLSTPADAQLWSGLLGAGWYMSWGTDTPAYEQPEFWQTVRINPKSAPGAGWPSLEDSVVLAGSRPGAVWIIGNEPDNIWQDNVTPELYARLYHDYWVAIKTADPSAQIAIAGVSGTTRLRMAYLERVLAEYERLYGEKLPVDWWNVHGYVLREERDSWGIDIPPGFSETTGMLIEPDQHGDLALFEQGIRSFRDWMARNGYRDYPLALTEIGLLMGPDFGYTPEIYSAYLTDTFTWLDQAVDEQSGYPPDGNRLVQRWAWFSLADAVYPICDLVDLESGKLTPSGFAFRQFVQDHVPSQ